MDDHVRAARAFRYCFYCGERGVKGHRHSHATLGGPDVECVTVMAEELPDGKVVPFGLVNPWPKKRKPSCW